MLHQLSTVPSAVLKLQMLYIHTLSMVMLGMDLLSSENSCSNFCAAFVGWKLPGLLPDLSCEVGEEEERGSEVTSEDVGAFVGDREMGCDCQYGMS